MPTGPVSSRALPRIVLLIPLANLLATAIALLFAPTSRPDQYFRETEVLTWLNSAELFMAGLLGLTIWDQCQSAEDRRRNRFWLLAGCFLIYLAADEFLQYHEHLGLWLERQTPLRAPRIVGPLDNLFLLVYAGLVGGLALVYRGRLLASPRTLLLLIAAGVVMTGSQLADHLTSGLIFRRSDGLSYLWAQAVEESLKFLATGFLLAAALLELLSDAAYKTINTDGEEVSAARNSGSTPRMGSPLLISLFAVQLLVLAYGLLQGVAQDNIDALMGRMNLLTWFASLERVAAGGLAVVIAALAREKKRNSRAVRSFWAAAALLLALSGAELYFGLARELGLQLGVARRSAQLIILLTSAVIAGGILLFGRKILTSANYGARQALLVSAALGSISIVSALIAAVAPPGRTINYLSVVGFCAGYLASFCLLWGVCAYLRSASGRSERLSSAAVSSRQPGSSQ